jgi:hypothetical protein
MMWMKMRKKKRKNEIKEEGVTKKNMWGKN